MGLQEWGAIAAYFDVNLLSWRYDPWLRISYDLCGTCWLIHIKGSAEKMGAPNFRCKVSNELIPGSVYLARVHGLSSCSKFSPIMSINEAGIVPYLHVLSVQAVMPCMPVWVIWSLSSHDYRCGSLVLLIISCF